MRNMTNINVKLDKKAKAVVAKTANIGGGVTPTGTLNIAENGEYDVTNYASANVAVEAMNFSPYLFFKGDRPTKLTVDFSAGSYKIRPYDDNSH